MSDPDDPQPGGRGNPSVMPLDGPLIIEEVLATYSVFKGPGQVLLLFDNEGTMYEPDQLPEVFKGHLGSPHRYALLRGLRDARGVRELEKAEFARPPATGYVISGLSHDVGSGWYWRNPVTREDAYICAHADGIRVDAFWNRGKGETLAQAGHGESWLSVLGVVHGEEYVHVRGKGSDSRDLLLLVYCPIMTQRQFTLLVATGTHKNKATGARLVTYRIARTGKTEVEFQTPHLSYDRPRYVVTERNGVVRLFKHPLY